MIRTVATLALTVLLYAGAGFSTHALTVTIDTSFDDNNFFNTPAKLAAIQAAGDRWSRVINSSLAAVGPSGNGTTQAGWRVGFSHPATGNAFEYSTAANAASDPLITAGADPADGYGFTGLGVDQWVLFVGGRALGGPAGVGGTGIATNFTTTFTDPNGPMHRGVISETPGAGQDTVLDLPAWGGSISFDPALAWHFDSTTAAPSGTVDFYTVALHEVGHALGLSLSFNQWTVLQDGVSFLGPEALAAYNADNNAAEEDLTLQSETNRHWDEGVYDTEIFPGGDPNYVGTVGPGALQDLIMEPTINFTGSIRRLELTNVDVGAIRDLGWGTVAIPEASAVLFFGLLTIGFVSRRG